MLNWRNRRNFSVCGNQVDIVIRPPPNHVQNITRLKPLPSAPVYTPINILLLENENLEISNLSYEKMEKQFCRLSKMDSKSIQKLGEDLTFKKNMKMQPKGET